MPLPSPRKGQSKDDFVNICMDDTKMLNEFPDDKQRAAVCYSQYSKSNANLEKQGDKMIVDFSDQIKSSKENKTLNKPFRTPKGPKKFSVYVKNEKGNIVKVNFGDPNMEIKRDDPNRRKNFRARHNCDNPGPKTKARYWSCRQWRGGKKVEASIQSTVDNEYEWDGETIFNHDELLAMNPELASVTEEVTEKDDCGCEECSCEEANTSESALTEKQKKLPPALQKQILKKQGKKPEDKEDTSEKDKDEKGKDEDKDEAKKGLTEKQKKLPPALQKAILKKQSKADSEDHEVSMAEIQLRKIAQKAATLSMLMSRMPKDANIMAWVQDKISKSEHMMEAAYDYMVYQYSNNASECEPKGETGEIGEAGEGDLQDYASLWENIRKKKERIKSGSGEKMRKKGDKGAPTAEQIKKAQKKAKDYGKVTANYEMSLEEYDEVMSGEELDLEDSTAKRSGPKSAAQTPAKPSERKKGSSKNPKGSAGKGGGSITFSEKVLTSLKNKVKEHNAKHSKKVTLGQLKKVYRRGAGAFSQSHRPNMSRGGWAMARVNMFLKMKRGGKVKDSYRKADGDI
tara:strand:+ start:1845 stop:3554 length:1710 start_codon:yes stop_codon:yes gene_type:complete